MKEEIEYAFPTAEYSTDPGGNLIEVPSRGMTLRDWFAAHCPLTFTELVNINTRLSPELLTNEYCFSELTRLSYIYADTMMEARKK